MARGEPPPAEDPHAVLGVAEGASEAAIRAAYRRKALETHPDRGGNPGTFLQVQHASERANNKAKARTALLPD